MKDNNTSARGSALTLIREERIVHDGNGLQLEDDLYIKLDAAFDELVADLGRGGQLPALIHIFLREAYASSGRGTPATLKTIAHAASCEERQARRIVKSLLEKTLIAEAGVSPVTGEKFYRPVGYAWFGNRRSMSSMTPPVKCHPPVPVVVDDQRVLNQPIPLKDNNNTSETRTLLQQCGIFGKPLNVLSETVSVETARAWLGWVESKPANVRNPAGVIVNALLADPDSAPPAVRKADEPRKRKPQISGKLAPKQKEEPC